MQDFTVLASFLYGQLMKFSTHPRKPEMILSSNYSSPVRVIEYK